MPNDKMAINNIQMNPVPEIIQLSSVHSTNTHLKELLKQQTLTEGSVVITNNQTAGRGQPGNSWESESGKNLTFSIILYPDMVSPTHQFIISKTIAVALTIALEKFISPIKIKWPNDIYFNDNKLGGILIENSLSGNIISHSVIGIGININQTSFSPSIPNPTSMQLITGKKWDLKNIFLQLYQSILTHYEHLTNKNTELIEKNYLTHLYRKEGFFKFRDNNGEFMASFNKIGPSGHLYLTRQDGVISKYAFKEVEFII